MRIESDTLVLPRPVSVWGMTFEVFEDNRCRSQHRTHKVWRCDLVAFLRIRCRFNRDR